MVVQGLKKLMTYNVANKLPVMTNKYTYILGLYKNVNSLWIDLHVTTGLIGLTHDQSQTERPTRLLRTTCLREMLPNKFHNQDF